ncbi:unnamed protein product [Haemonchus placei]|uniref:DUF1985 domain-containing protein n=1 Tax=Haemonchus placei TaxID=6290 RepID=A0A0N4XAH0_HAEPC|nr:unnamed protein product [Haemonchus placei]
MVSSSVYFFHEFRGTVSQSRNTHFSAYLLFIMIVVIIYWLPFIFLLIYYYYLLFYGTFSVLSKRYQHPYCRLFIRDMERSGLRKKQTEIRQIFMHVLIRDGFFADQWLFSHEAEYPSELCKDAIEFLCSASKMDCSGSKIFNDDIHNVCPALKYFESQNDVLWSWRQVMRFLVLLSTTRWENLLQCSDHFKDDVFAKVWNISLTIFFRALRCFQ